MAGYSSDQAFFKAVEQLAKDLALDGNDQLAQEVNKGLRSLNGLTDGWALLLDSLLKVRDQSSEMSAGQFEALNELIAVAHKVVYR